MSPEIRKNGKLIIDAPDKTGVYEGVNVHMDSLHPDNAVNEVFLSGAAYLERRGSATSKTDSRAVQLNRKGFGVVMLKGGETLTVQLKNPDLVKKPVRRTRTKRPWKEWV